MQDSVKNCRISATPHTVKINLANCHKLLATHCQEKKFSIAILLAEQVFLQMKLFGRVVPIY
jgi:hypothetical protein